MDIEKISLDYAGLKEINADERYYNPGKCGMYDAFKAGYQLAQPEWLSIDSAPKDKQILIVDGFGQIFNGFWQPDHPGDWMPWKISYTNRDCGNGYNSGYDDIQNPVAWMPLPQYP